MGKIDDLIQFCLSKYTNPGTCLHCAYRNCMREGSADCYKCLNKIHSVGNNTMTYSCENMIYCYVLKHLERYASEIEYVWAKYNMHNAHVDIHAASIGTGPSPELYSMVDYMEKNPINVNFSFVGFDHNAIWTPIWNFSMNNIEGVSYETSDFITYYDAHSKPNVLILSYVLSDIVRTCAPNERKAFLDNLVTFILSMPKGVIIINDIPYFGGNYIDLRTAHVCMEYVAQALSRKAPGIFGIYRHRFLDYRYWSAGYGTKYYANSLMARTAYDISRFDPFVYCNSIQMHIIKNHDN